MRLFPALLFLAAAAFWPHSGLAQSTINGFSLPNYVLPGYVIGADGVDGDPSTNRNLIDTQSSITINSAGSYRVEWELLAPNDAIMAANATDMGTIASVPVTQMVTGTLAPSAANPLLVGVYYRLRVRLVNTTSGAVTEDTGTQATGKTYIHLAGTDPGTVALNVVSEMTSLTIDRAWLLETNANRRTIPVTVNYTLHRYDNWDGVNTQNSVFVNLNTSLIRDSNNNAQNVTVSGNPIVVSGVSSYALSGPLKVPAVVSGSVQIEIDPASILRSTEYRVESQITHQDQILPPVTATGNTLVSAVKTIAHMTGQLYFGAVSTHFANLNGGVTIPTQVVPPSGSLVVHIAPSNMSGTVDGFTDSHFGDGTRSINAALDTNGVLTCSGDFTDPSTTYVSETLELLLDPGGNNAGSVNGVPFKRADPIKLMQSGVLAAITAYLPVGVGWRDDPYNGILSDAVDFADVYLTQTLEPNANPSISPGANHFYLCEETKPVLVECTTLEWDLPSGEFRAGSVQQAHSVRKPLLDFMASYAASYPNADMATKKSNDHLYNTVTGAAATRVKTGTSGGGELTTALSTGASLFTTHFPWASQVKWDAALSVITIQNDLINPALSSLNTAWAAVVPYSQHCQDEYEHGCGEIVGDFVTLTSSTGDFKLTADGGVFAAGAVTMSPLKWGAIPKAQPSDPQTFAHKVTTAFTQGDFLMAGTFLRGDQNPLADQDGAPLLLLTGFDPADLAVPERPLTASYLAGLADYAGMNFRTSSGSFDGQSRIQDDPYGPYDLTARSKYYVRYSGVSGIHEAPSGGFPGTATIADYMFGFTNFGFSFLSNEQEDSRTSGYLDLPDPTDFTLNFTELRLSCLGALESFQITGAGTVDSKEFDFWNGLFTPYTATFESKSECFPGDGTTLVLGFSGHASHFADPFAGALGILPTGDFATQNDVNTAAVADTVPVRLTLPAAMKMIGTTNESYEFFPAQGAYMNDANGAADGFWSLFGTLDVPFFKDLQVHLHTRCGTLTQGTELDTASVLYAMGGWPSHGWEISGNDPFEINVFDVNHKGYTNTLAHYRKTTDNGSEQFLVRAQQLWIDVINFDYPLKWSNAAFNFTGRGPITSDFIVLSTQHELHYLDANNAYLTFGACYDGLPEINLTSFVFNEIDDLTGTAAAFVRAAGGTVFDTLENGVDAMAKTVSDKAEDVLGTSLDGLTSPVLDDLIDQLKATISPGPYTQTDINNVVNAYLGNPSALSLALNHLDDGPANPNSLRAELERRMAKMDQAIGAVIDQVTADPDSGAVLPVAVDGLLKKTNAFGSKERPVFELLGKELVTELTTLVDESAIDAQLKALIQDQSPTLDSVVNTLTDLRAIINDLRYQNYYGTNFGAELQDLINSPEGQADIASVCNETKAAALDIIGSATVEDLAQLDALTAEWRAEIAEKLRDSFYAKLLAGGLQQAIKERLYDVQASFNESVDTAFAALNRAMKDAISDELAALDNTLMPIYGSFANAVEFASLTGFAHINSDSLDVLRMDALVKMNLPDPMTLNGYFQIRELDSDGPGACSGAVGAKTAEITLGTEDMSLGWVGLGLSNDARADMSVKFGISSGLPVSLGGAFELTNGEIHFETFEIYKLAASMMFGSTENYVAAGVGVRFGEFDMAGGIFLGRSCSLEPLEMIDPLVAEVVPTSSLTGIYAYGEATFPIFGTGTCFFNISAKAGAGVLYFAEGPTYGGRMTLGVYGEALCAVEVGGEVSLAGTKSGDTYNFAGYGKVSGKAGVCPLCVKAHFQVDFGYTDAGGWHVDF